MENCWIIPIYMLYDNPELDLETVFLLDQIQKGYGENLPITAIEYLRKNQLLKEDAIQLHFYN